ncbi:hypothetical protein QQ045_014720 [Rhodiola kirilowii]
MNNFRNCLHDCGLTDLGAEGDRFTYSNRCRGENEVEACLDRVVVNQAWRSLFPNAVVRHSVANTSDHKPIVLYTSERVKTCKEKVVRFEPMWLRHKDFKNRVQEYWKELEGVNDMAEKLRRCMQRLNRWNWSVFGNVRKRIDSLKERLQCVRNMPRTHDRYFTHSPDFLLHPRRSSSAPRNPNLDHEHDRDRHADDALIVAGAGHAVVDVDARDMIPERSPGGARDPGTMVDGIWRGEIDG